MICKREGQSHGILFTVFPAHCARLVHGLAATKLLGRKFRNNGRHAMRGKVVRTTP